MPVTTKIPREQLAEYFESFTKQYIRADSAPEGIDVEIVSPDLGHQQLVRGARLEGITYDIQSDALEIALDTGGHRVNKPREVWAMMEPNGFPKSLEVIRADGTRELISVKRVVERRLPPAEEAH
ncbi:MAG TPA: DUF5335 family protein [Gemmatimonadaceae bacterium]|nr:DUF5335 family protein [Gemmatimonadaceae bacterium]